MNCLWCQNPEGMNSGQEIWWEGRKCIHCLACREACPADAVAEDESGLRVERELCTLCGACVEACPSLAMSFTGQEWSLDALVAEALKDKDYYEAFGGGVTASGGEPLCQHRFVAEFFKRLKERGVHTALDSCGLAPVEALHSVLPYTDCVLYDIKILDPRLHRKYTGQDNEAILANLAHIANAIRANGRPGNPGRTKTLWIRTPLIPGTTATEANIAAIGEYIRGNLLDVVERWELCAFNSACNMKYRKMRLAWAYEGCELMRQGDVDVLKATALSAGFPDEKLVVSGLIAGLPDVRLRG